MRILVTGGAGFIGSHLSRRLLELGHDVRVLDDLSTGHRSNLDGVAVELIEGDLTDSDVLTSALRGVEAVHHVAARPSVARSWADPVATLAVNAQGTAKVMKAAIAAGARRVVYSSSSSVYGDQPADAKSEDLEPRPISPYGFSKLLGEEIALAHARAGDIGVLALRYFNVFGPRQDPDSPYSAVIPIFIKSALAGVTATVHGDGEQSRDFTFVDNVVHANVLALESDASGAAVNVACGAAITLNDLVGAISGLDGHPLRIEHGEPRAGDIKHSLADLSRAEQLLGYHPIVDFDTGLRRTYEAFATA